MTIERRAVLKAAILAVAGATLAEQLAACDGHADTAIRIATASPGGTSAATRPGATTSAGAAPSTSGAPSAGGAPSTGGGASAHGAPGSSNTPRSSEPSTSSDPASTRSPGGPAIEIVHGPAGATGVALTFHGAGDPALANQLLREVESAGGLVTVLAVGTWLEAQPQMAKRIIDAGHELGNHTYRHLTMTSLSASVDDSEITRCAAVLRKLTGSQGRWFRPSGTVHATLAILASAGRAGYANSLSYDVDPSDYADPGAAKVVSRVLAAVRSGSIVSLHLGHAGTVQAMPQILDGLKTRGLAAVTMSSLMSSGAVG